MPRILTPDDTPRVPPPDVLGPDVLARRASPRSAACLGVRAKRGSPNDSPTRTPPERPRAPAAAARVKPAAPAPRAARPATGVRRRRARSAAAFCRALAVRDVQQRV